MKRLLLIFLVAAAVSCAKTDPILYRVITFGYPNGRSLLADDGMLYRFPTAASTFNWKEAERVFAVFDVTRAVSDSVFEAKLINYSVPLYKEPAVVNGQEEADALGTSGIKVADIWYSGGCLNMINVIKVVEGGKEQHFINLAKDSGQPDGDTLKLSLHHRPEPAPPDDDTLTDYTFYSSFPLKDILPGSGSTVIKVSWNWDGEDCSSGGAVKIDRK